MYNAIFLKINFLLFIKIYHYEKFSRKFIDSQSRKNSTVSAFYLGIGLDKPFYCDNRKLISYPEIRDYLKVKIAGLIFDKYPECEGIAGVATGAIPISAIVADTMGLPLRLHPLCSKRSRYQKSD